ncbi:immunoglobulin-like domain-containing protein, partial [Oleiphilus sp. HI0080]
IVADTTVPVITLTGDTNIDIALGDLFVDPGYSASDNIDGDLSSSVSPTGNVDINTEGTYILSYDVSDTAGNSAVTQTRTVNVVTPVTISFEAETATISGAHTVASTNTGFTGSGYIEHSGEGFVEYTFNAFELPYDLVVRYAWDSGDRPLEVILNGQSLGTLSFPATGSLTTWLDTASFALTPQSGSNTLRLETTGSSGANLDSISLTPQ